MSRTHNNMVTVWMVLAVSAATIGCSRTDIVELPPTKIEVSVEGFAGTVSLPYGSVFDNIRTDISGMGWDIIETVRAQVTDGRVVLTLPDDIPDEKLCKSVRDSYNDYEGFWPAEEASDRTAKVAGLGDIIAYRGDTKVGRLSLTDWDGTPDDIEDKYFIYYHYSDMPFALSGHNLTNPRENGKSFRYEASFSAGWNAYAYVNRNGLSLCTTDIPANVALQWRFEKW